MTDIPKPALVSPGLLGTRIIQDESRPSFDRRNLLMLMEGQRPGLLFIGDSLTGDWPTAESFGTKYGIVINRGIGGDAAMHVHLRMQADVVQLKPERVHFMIGTNDIAFRFGYDTDEKILTDIQANYLKSFAMLRACGARIYIGAVPPVRPTLLSDIMAARKRVLIPAVNEFLRRQAEAHGFTFVDYQPELEESRGVLRPDVTTDGCHLNSAGYWIMGRVLRAALDR